MIRLIKEMGGRLALRRLGEWEKIDYFRRTLGVHGSGRVRITGVVHWGSEPFLIEIGDNVTIADGVRFITHDGGAGLFRDTHPGLNVFGRIRIGSNVFIGTSAILLPGVTVGDQVVIGAGSVVSRDIPSCVVAAGNPARVIKSLDEYRERMLGRGVTVDETGGLREQAIASALAHQSGDHR